MLLALSVVFLFAISASAALAHCPLCTAGAGLAAGLAAWLGVSELSIGLFIGAFAVAVGIWIANILKFNFKGKSEALITVSFATTIFPLLYMFSESIPLYINWYGGYG
ncbi:MAG: hypothetical protein ABEH43_04435, partial [Flavobacteriales bacterium]